MLKPKRKITRKEIKKDPLLEKISQAETIIRQKPKQISYITIGLVVIIVLSFVMIRSKKTANRKAAGELGIAELSIQDGDYDDAILRLEKLVDIYSGTNSAGMAEILLAQTYLTKSDYENAEKCFQKYVDDFAHDDMALASAYNGLGICYEHNDDHKEAAEHFEKGAKLAPFKFQKHECLINAVRNLIEIRELEKAEILLNEVLNNEPDHKYKNVAETLSAEIEVLKG
ncbi:MAG: hypothetical protein DRP89_05575 [Candidatus Neomarinimicrobiota bacterium]|nr:MAG: hypothetical protein DRP89_05575 [Candidatus Neomarinimicrobiota bacterium]